ncbi:MAG TPA: HoxN/HupN/NixA family nickel/cobalt transporter [bacterium]|nr:HoxN/HupN/NixA family nickel/cobalt transporter [bacterium]
MLMKDSAVARAWRHCLHSGARRRAVGLVALLAAGNAAAWCWALAAFHGHPVLLGSSLLAYTLGLRHAMDADHIAAIDNVTRKLVQRGRRPVSVGFFFSLGHSTVVFGLSGAMVLGAVALDGRLGSFQSAGRVLGTAVSAAFLLTLAVVNLVILASVYRGFDRVRRGGSCGEEDLARALMGDGRLGRLLRWLFGLVDHPWQMFPVGFLFGLGFDTATEIALLGLSATEATQGLPLRSILVFPALFTAGMVLVDSADSLLMVGAYSWAFIQPARKLYYNLTVTLVSVLVALLVGGIEVLSLIGDQFGLKGGLWDLAAFLNGHFGAMGVATAAVFVFGWLVSMAVYRWRRFDERIVG